MNAEEAKKYGLIDKVISDDLKNEIQKMVNQIKMM